VERALTRHKRPDFADPGPTTSVTLANTRPATLRNRLTSCQARKRLRNRSFHRRVGQPTKFFAPPDPPKEFCVTDACRERSVCRPALLRCLARGPGGYVSVAGRCSVTTSGPVCESAGFFWAVSARSRRRRDLLAIMSAGAYGMTMSRTTIPAPVLRVMVDGKTAPPRSGSVKRRKPLCIGASFSVNLRFADQASGTTGGEPGSTDWNTPAFSRG